MVVTIAVKLPAIGFVLKVTVSVVAVAAVTVPIAFRLKVTKLFPGVVLKLVPRMVIVFAVAAIPVVLEVTVGAAMAATTCATCTAAPLVLVLVVTTAVKLPRIVGCLERVTVSDVRLAVVTVPSAFPLKTTEFRFAIESKPKPLMIKLVPLMAKVVVLLVTTGVTAATCTAVPELTPLVVTTAVSTPA